MKRIILFVVLLLSVTICRAQIITTIAGGGFDTSDGIPATNAYLYGTTAIAFDKYGNYYLADGGQFKIKKIDTNGIITTYAGCGRIGYTGDNGPATLARLNTPYDLALDSKGNLYFTDYSENVVRKVDTNGIISTFAGNGVWGYSNDSILATSANLMSPVGITIDKYNNVYISDGYPDLTRIRKIDTTGIIYTVIGSGTTGYSGDSGNAKLAMISSQFLKIDSSGIIWLSEWRYNRIRTVDTDGIIRTIAGNGVMGYAGDSIPASMSIINSPEGLCPSTAYGLWFVDGGNCRVRFINKDGIIITIAGTGVNGYNGDNQPPLDAKMGPWDVAIDAVGSVYIVDAATGRVRYIRNTTFVREVLNQTPNFSIFPNPASGIFHVSISQANLLPLSYFIIDATGKVVSEGNLMTTDTELTTSFSSGLYFFSVQYKGMTFTRPFRQNK